MALVCGVGTPSVWRESNGHFERRRVCRAAVTKQASYGEQALSSALLGVGGRGRIVSQDQFKAIADAVTALETECGIESPTSSSCIEGLWRLVYTTRPSTASPIQRTFVGVDAFTVFQEIRLSGTDDKRVSNIVKFSDSIGELKVEAEASVASNKRINFRFDKAAFSFTFIPFKVPYPVPFRLLGDEAKGWLDTTYLSENIRISRGNKGTTFVLQKELDPRQKLLAAISSGKNIEKAIEDVIQVNPTDSPASLEVLAGKWRLVWSSQAEDANWLQKSTSSLPSWQIVKENTGDLENLVEFFAGVGLKARAISKASSSRRREVEIQGAEVKLGPISIPLNITGNGYVDLLYIDDKLRISKGNKGSTFIHIRE